MTERLCSFDARLNPEDATSQASGEPDFVYSKSSILSNLPLPLPDQTFDSLVAMVGIQNGLRVGSESLRVILGSASIKTDRLFHVGTFRAYEALQGSVYDSYEEFIAKHTFLPLFKPFIPEKTYRRIEKDLKSDTVGGLSNVLASDSAPRQRHAYRYCVHCAENSIQARGFAYAQRTHQIPGVDFCYEHGTVLTSASPDIHPNKALAHGLILPTDNCEWQSMLIPIIPLGDSPAWRSFVKWVEIALQGKFPVASEGMRTMLLQHKIREITKERGFTDPPAVLLQRHLIRSYGAEALEKLGLPIFTASTAHWPTFLILGTKYADHPIANLLAFAALFDSPHDVTKRIARFEKFLVPRYESISAFAGVRLNFA